MLVLVAIALYGVFVTHAGGLWRDEANSLATVSGSWADQARLMEFEAFPTFWPLLLRGWIAAVGGASDTSLRVFGALDGLALVAAVWFALRRLGKTVPLLSLALIVVNPEIVRRGGSLRAWSLGAALILVAIAVFWETAQRWSPRRAAIVTCVALLAVQTTYQNSVVMAAIVCCAMTVAWFRRAWASVAALLAVALVSVASLVPYASIFARRGDWNRLSETPLTVANLASRFWEVASSAGGVVAAVWISTIVVAAFCLTRPSVNRTARAYAVSVCVLSVVAIGGFYFQFRYPTQRWYYLSLTSIVAVTAEAVIVLSAGVAVRRLRMILAVGVVIAGLGPTIRALQPPQTSVDSVATHLFANATRDDLVVVYPWFYAVSFARYDRGPADVMTIPPLAEIRAHRYDLVKSAMLHPDPLRPLVDRLQSVLSSGGRVWVIGELPRVPAFARIPRLGPPPLPETGWRSDPYEARWSQEVSQFLAVHATNTRIVPIPGSSDAFEAPALTMFEGWK